MFENQNSKVHYLLSTLLLKLVNEKKIILYYCHIVCIILLFFK